MSMENPHRTKILILAVLMMASGCSDENARVAQVSVEAAQRQADQNQEMSRLNRRSGRVRPGALSAFLTRRLAVLA
jgi:hypothetical protein